MKGHVVRLVDNWNEALGWLSMRFIGLALIWEGIPLEAKAVIPEYWQGWITIALLVGAGIGRMIKQEQTQPEGQE